MLAGLLVYRFPMLISGVNTMSKERLSKVNLEGLKRVMRNAFLISGAIVILLGGLSTLVHIREDVHYALMMAVVFGMVIAVLLLSRRYDAGLQGEAGRKERRKSWIAIILVAVVLLATVFFFFVGTKPATVDVSADGITAKGGGYSATIPVADISEATVLSDWPAISLRTNGVGTDKVCIGHFRLKNDEKCMMFLCVDGGPVLEVRTVDGKLYYFNCATEEETKEMIDKVKAVLGANSVIGNYNAYSLYPHGGQGSAISQTRRRHPSAFGIAGRARNEGKEQGVVVLGDVSKTTML